VVDPEMGMKARTLTAVLVVVLVVPAFAAADVAVSAGANVCLLRQKEVREAYGSSFPVGLQVWSGWKNWRFSVGLEFLSDGGRAFSSGGGQEDYPLRLTVTTIPVGIYYQVWIKDLFLAFGGGTGYTWFEEKWEDLDIVVKGKNWGAFAAFFGGYRVNPRFSVYGSVRYDPMPTGKGSLLVRQVNLGGLKIGAGIMFFL
jgi:opacity protein-like surface antigen